MHEECNTPNGKGKYRTYVNEAYWWWQPERYSSIHWSPKTGAHVTQGGIRKQWEQLGFENGFLGFPTSDEIPFTKDGVITESFAGEEVIGKVSYFEGGAIYWYAATNDISVYSKQEGQFKYKQEQYTKGFPPVHARDIVPLLEKVALEIFKKTMQG